MDTLVQLELVSNIACFLDIKSFKSFRHTCKQTRDACDNLQLKRRLLFKHPHYFVYDSQVDGINVSTRCLVSPMSDHELRLSKLIIYNDGGLMRDGRGMIRLGYVWNTDFIHIKDDWNQTLVVEEYIKGLDWSLVHFVDTRTPKRPNHMSIFACNIV